MSRLPPYIATNGPVTQLHGPEMPTYYSGNPLNRLSFLRESIPFLQSTFVTALYLPFSNSTFRLDPLGKSDSELGYITYHDLAEHMMDPFMGLSSEEDFIAKYSSVAEENRPSMVFLGVDESDKSSGWKWKEWTGRPYWAIDWTGRPNVWSGKGQSWDFRSARDIKLGHTDAAILAMARSYLDWNLRNRHCAGCGSRTLSIHGGAKRVCPPVDNGVLDERCGPSRRPECFTRIKNSVHNISFPRTDPTVIVAIINHTGDKILLGRRPVWPKSFYSCLAGFCEPGESIEDSVRREGFEEAGVTIGRVILQSTQPWPFPNSLMIGCIAETIPGGEKINLGNDAELQDAKWFTFEEVRVALEKHEWGSLEGPDAPDAPKLSIPPSIAIANRLVERVIAEYSGKKVGGEEKRVGVPAEAKAAGQVEKAEEKVEANL